MLWHSDRGLRGSVRFRADEHGEVSIPITEEDCRAAELGASFQLIPDGRFGSFEACAFDPRNAASSSPIELQSSRGEGRLEIRVAHGDARIVDEPFLISCRCIGHTCRDGTTSAYSSYRRNCETVNGSATVRELPLGCRWRVLAQSADHAHELVSVEIEGPRYPEETVVCTLRPGEERPAALLRLRDEQGQPVAPGGWRVQVKAPEGTILVTWASSDASGVLRVPLMKAKGEVLLQELELVSSGLRGTWSAGGSRQGRRIDRHVDLGLVACGLSDLAISGVVVDGLGVPIPYARVRVEEELSMGSTNASSFSPQEANTDEHGRFRLLVDDSIDAIRICAQHEEHLDLHVFGISMRDPKRADLHLVMQRTGSLEGQLLVDRPADLDRFVIFVEDSAGKVHAIASHFGGEHFEVGGLDPAKSYSLRCGVPAWCVGPDEQAPGSERLRVIEKGDLITVLMIEGLRVPLRGGACTDPRLRQLDLRGSLVLRQATFRDAEDQALAGAHMTLVQRESTGVLRSIPQLTDALGRCEWLAPITVVELTAYADGYALATLDCLAVAQVVQLVPRSLEIEVRLQAEEGRSASDPRATHLLVLPKKFSPEWIAAIHYRNIEGNEHLQEGLARFSLPAPGLYEVLLMSCAGGQGRPCPRMFPMTDCGEIEVLEQEGVQRFRVVARGERW
jgi:hypothetical protein